MNNPETVLKNQVRNINAFIQGIKKIPNPVVLGGVPFFLKDLKQMSADMKFNTTYIEFEIAALKRENIELKRGFKR